MSTSDATVVLLIRLAKSVYKYATDDVLGIRLKEYVTLSNLREGARAQSELCATMHMDANNCVLLLNELEDAGWTQRTRDPGDRRRHVVVITAKGRTALERARAAQETLEDEVFASLDPEEREQLRELLRKTLVGLHPRAEEPVAP